MAELKYYSLKIPIDPKGELHNRIKQSAEERGISFETALDEAVQVGICGQYGFVAQR